MKVTDKQIYAAYQDHPNDVIAFGRKVLELAEAAIDEHANSYAVIDQADAWQSVFAALTEVCPGWTNGNRSGVDAACQTIRDLAKRAALEYARGEQEPVFWYRPCSDGGYEGPVHNNAIEECRKHSGAWVPLFPNQAAKPGDLLRGTTKMIEDESLPGLVEQPLAKPVEISTVTPYSLDLDPLGIRRLVCNAVTGAMCFGAQNSNHPPKGHWLEEFWNMARNERELASRNETVVSDEAVRALVGRAVEFAIARCQEATGQYKQIEKYVNSIAITNEALAAYKETTKS